MSDETKLMLGFLVLLAVVCISGIFVDLGKENAKTMQTCYEAAKVNSNIKCDAK